MAFVIASAVAGLAGSFQAHYIGVIVPESFDIYKTIYVQIYAILGGVDFAILGPLTGALIMTFVPELLRSIKEYEPIITGLIIVLLLLFLPGGLLSLLGFRRLHINPHENISRLAKVTKSLLPSNWRR
jgi:branched-chain amino acid transport system permease protein